MGEVSHVTVVKVEGRRSATLREVGDRLILDRAEVESLPAAARSLGMSYRGLRERLRRMNAPVAVGKYRGHTVDCGCSDRRAGCASLGADERARRMREGLAEKRVPLEAEV